MAFAIYKTNGNSYNVEVECGNGAGRRTPERSPKVVPENVIENVTENVTEKTTEVPRDNKKPQRLNCWKTLFFLSVVIIFMVLLPVAIWSTVKASKKIVFSQRYVILTLILSQTCQNIAVI